MSSIHESTWSDNLILSEQREDRDGGERDTRSEAPDHSRNDPQIGPAVLFALPGSRAKVLECQDPLTDDPDANGSPERNLGSGLRENQGHIPQLAANPSAVRDSKG